MKNNLIDLISVKNIILDLYKQQGCRSLAWELLDQYFKKATTLEEYDLLGYAALKVEKRDTFLKCAEYSYILANDSKQKYLARINLYKAYNAMNMPEKALFYIEQNLEEDPDDVDALSHKAFNLSLMNRKQESEDFLNKAMEKNPHLFVHNKLDKYDRVFCGKLLREGETARGILAFIQSSKEENYLFNYDLKMTPWRGAITPGKTLYIDMEGGFGDQIINIRFFDRIKSFGMNPILVSQSNSYYHSINKMLIRHGYKIISEKFLIDKTCQWTSMMVLPGYLGLSESQLWTGPYLTPLRQKKNQLNSKKFKIGIKNSGNPYFWQDEYRTVPIEQIIKSLPKDVEIYYIDTKKLEYSDNRIVDLSSRIADWEDTLDFIDQMDCIVSTCTSIVHAAAAMSKPTFVLIPIAEYYIWTSTRTDGSSPWYDHNLYLAKQTKVRDWTGPLEEIKNRVENMLRKHYE